MFRTGIKKPEQERLLLNRKSLETSLPELRQPLAYVRHLRSCWKPEGRAKLIVPTSWMEFLAFDDDGKCGVDCIVDRCCPFRNVRFESNARLVGPGEELPRDTVSQILTGFGMDDCLATLVPRAFEGIPRTTLRSDLPSTRRFSQSTPRRNVDFALVPGHGSNAADHIPLESDTQCLLLGTKEPAEAQHPHSTSFDSRTLACSIPEELTSQGQLHLTLLAPLIKGGAVGTTTESFPEWLVLFGLIYGAHHVRVVAYVPHRRTLDVIECAVYIVDELSFRSVAGVPRCELALERLRLLLALTTLRRHVHHLSKSLFSVIDGIRRTNHPPSFLGCSAHDQHHSDDSESLYPCASSLGSSQHCSSEYSTCPSSVRVHERNEDLVPECEEEPSSSCRSFTSSSCSTSLSSLESASTSDSLNSKYTHSDYMEPSTISLSQGGNKRVSCPNKLTETNRREIIAWARQVIPTEHPVKDTYRMVIS